MQVNLHLLKANMNITLPQQLLKSALRAVYARQSQTLKQGFMI